jgi:hypothetical protein
MQQNAKRGHDGNVDFKRIEPSDLRGTVYVAVQALDNQWVPRSLLRKALQTGLTASIERQRQRQVRNEYVRALVNSERVVINRAFIYNSHAVFQDFLQKGSEERQAFETLLEKGVIMPYLFNETSPVDKPAYGTEPDGFKAWQEVSQEAEMECVRLSWNEKLNSELTREHLARRFHNFAVTASSGNIATYLRSLSLNRRAKKDSSAEEALTKRLVEMAQISLGFISQGKLATRDELYKAFIISGENTALRQYDGTKLFAGEIKQLLDLAYNRNLPDALGGYLLTPIDSLPRTALQELEQAVQQPEITADELIKLLQRSIFEYVMRGSYLKSMGLLPLQDVRETRGLDEWQVYIDSLKALLDKPVEIKNDVASVREDYFEDAVARVHRSYSDLAGKMTGLVRRRYIQRGDQLIAPWTSGIELFIDVAGATLKVVGTETGEPIYQFSGEVATQVADKAAPVIARLVVRGVAGVRAQVDLFTSIDFMKCRMKDARKQWPDIVRRVQEMRGFQQGRSLSEQAVPTINHKEEPK